jgi:hypothetical protein
MAYKMKKPRPVRRSQLWEEFLGPDPEPGTHRTAGYHNVHCGLCGNTGIVDTRGRAKTPAGFDVGVLRYCICPNGRALKKQKADPEKGLAAAREMRRLGT